jgi:N-acetylglucosamine kinase-like BadF-type ATPase
MRYVLGIDGGGSKCDAALVDESGAVVGWGRGGPVHVYYDPPEVVASSFRDAFLGALAGRRVAELWVVGSPLRHEPPEQVLRAAAETAHYLEASEVDTAFASVQEEWGLVVLAGTGSFVHARRRDGRHLHWGGLGPILDDYGSGYEIGLRGLRAAFASQWGESRRTSLAEAVPRALGTASLREVFRLVYPIPQSWGPAPEGEGLGRRQIASLAKVVSEEAEGGDRVAADCLRRAADELANLAVDMIRELEMQQLSFPVIAIGSVAQRCRIWWEQVCARLAAVAPAARPVIPRLRPALGAALIGLRELGVEWSAELVQRLTDTQQARRPD